MRRYRALLRVPGARAPLIASALGSLPIGMYIIGILLLARAATGSFADAGRVAGAFGLANAFGAVAQGRLMDRHGQPRVLRAVAAGHALAIAVLVVAAERRAPAAVLALCAIAGGGFLPQVPAAMRSLWGLLVPDEQRRQAAYAMVAIVFEVSVVAAPALVAGIIALASPGAAVAAAGTVATGAALGFAATDASGRWRGEAHTTGWLGPLSAPGVRTVFAAVAALGAAIGVVQVAVPAFTAARGSAETGGLLLAALSAGSLGGGLVYGARTWPGRPAIRLALLLAALAGGCALLAAATSNPVLALILLAAGLFLAPASVAASALLDDVAPPGTVTEAFTTMIMGIVAGSALGNAIGGAIVDGPGYETSALTAAAIAATGAALTYARRSTLGTRRARTARSS
jgi:MFS family permease